MAFSIKVALLLSFFTFPLGVRSEAQSTIADDLVHRDAAIRWPKAFDPSTAPVFSHNEILLHAGCHEVWGQFLRVTDWPNWFVLTKDVTIEGSNKNVELGTRLRLKIFDSPITSLIDEFVPDSRLSWIPQGLDETKAAHYHTWHFIADPGGCRVVTEETGIGPNDIKSSKEISRMMHRAHELWLDSMKWKMEP